MTRASSPQIEFWYEFASTYSYLSAMRIEALAAAAGRDDRLEAAPARPDLPRPGLGHVAVQPLPGQGQVHGARHGAAGVGPRPSVQAAAAFPQNSLHAARLALIGHAERWGVAFTRAVYAASSPTAPISASSGCSGDPERLGLDAEALFVRSETPENKERLRQQTEEAQELGISALPPFWSGASCSGGTTGSSRR